MKREEQLAWWGAAGAAALALWWKGRIIVDTATDLINRGDLLTSAPMGDDGVVLGTPDELADQASAVLGRYVHPDTYSGARMIRSEGAAAGLLRAHVALNDARALGWTMRKLITYAIVSHSSPVQLHPAANGLYGEQFVPTDRAPDGIPITRRYASSKDPHAGDVLTYEQAVAEQAQGIDPTMGAVKFVDKSSLGIQVGSSKYEAIVARWGAQGLQPFTVDGWSDDFVVFRKA